MRGPVVRQLCVERNSETNKETNTLLLMNYMGGGGGGGGGSDSKSFMCCWFTNIAKYSRHPWSLLGANIR